MSGIAKKHRKIKGVEQAEFLEISRKDTMYSPRIEREAH